MYTPEHAGRQHSINEFRAAVRKDFPGRDLISKR